MGKKSEIKQLLPVDDGMKTADSDGKLKGFMKEIGMVCDI